MDLRRMLDQRSALEGARCLNYQPFLLADDLQTGAAYSWLKSADPRVKPPLVFHRAQWEQEWEAISDANARLRAMYDDFLDEVRGAIQRAHCSILAVTTAICS
jgi:hypothetical protein